MDINEIMAESKRKMRLHVLGIIIDVLNDIHDDKLDANDITYGGMRIIASDIVYNVMHGNVNSDENIRARVVKHVEDIINRMKMEKSTAEMNARVEEEKKNARG